jgi:hypothetical protein
MRSFAASERQETAALRDFNPVYVGLGSWLCKNALAEVILAV